MKTMAAHSISTPLIHRLQQRHFLLFDLIPHALVLTLPLYWGHIYSGWAEWLLFGLTWLFTSLGITAGFHRLIAHRSYKAHPLLLRVLAVAGSMSAQGAVTSWVAIHRVHHEKSDLEGDLHSPNLHGSGFWNGLRGMFHSHFGWMRHHPYPNTLRYAPDLLRDPVLTRINRQYHLWVAIGLAVPTAIGFALHGDLRGAVSGFLWGGVFRMVLLGQIIWSINSFAHKIGTRRYNTREFSKNMWWFSLLSLGESWHNNHHRFANSPCLGLEWYHPDPGYWFIRSMKAVGLATDLRVPTPEQMARFDAPLPAPDASPVPSLPTTAQPVAEKVAP